ncbi:MAG: putative nucleoside-diphosphate-sugar epimerase [Enterovirga sp.]|nr:putative nucleoside-diphosphate-sugar epimerase [Enterovirga sp.]
MGELGFPSLTFVRPGLIGGEREDIRIGEIVGQQVLRMLGRLVPRRFRLNPTETIAKALVEAVARLAARGGT